MNFAFLLLLLLFLTFLWSSTTVPTWASMIDFDESWQQRARQAQHAAQQAYQSDTQSVTDQINVEVHKTLERKSARRNLRKYTGACMATNPIDRCWRCDAKWYRRRKRLAECVLGFGRKTIGGKNGRYYIVSDPSDTDLVSPRPGTIRHAVTRDEPLWIIFGRDMIIKLSEELIINSYKTIDGRGANVHIAFGAQLTVQFAQHVIIHGIHIHHINPGGGGMVRDSEEHFGLRTRSDGDGITIFGSSNVWVDHVSMYRCSDGLIDIVQGSTAITLSNNHFTRHDHTMLFGATDSYPQDKIMQITVAFNHFGKGLIQRMPRCRFGFFHVLNNDYTHWNMYAIGGSKNPTIISQGNRYIAHPNVDSQHNSSEVTKRENAEESEWRNWMWRSENDVFRNGAFFVTSGPPVGPLGFSKQDVIKAKPGTYVTRLTRFAGALSCRKDVPC